MTAFDCPSTYKYRLELEIGVTSMIALSSGEMCDLIALGLFALDREGRLLPGVTLPNNVFGLVSTRITPVGYERQISLREAESVSRRRAAQSARNRLTETDAKLIDDLEVARDNLTDCFREQRMLQARIAGLFEKLGTVADIADDDRAYAASLLAAVDGVLQKHESVTRPVL